MVALANSTFLNAYGYQLATSLQIAGLAASNSLTNAQSMLSSVMGMAPYQLGPASDGQTITIGLTLNRANDPSALLASEWIVRQKALADQTAVFAKYGADATTYATVTQALSGIVGSSAIAAATAAGYVSSAADRTIWMTLNPTQFAALFRTDLLTGGGVFAWGGNLDVPDSIAANVRGVWIEQQAFLPNPVVLASQTVTLTPGWLSIGNASTSTAFPLPTAVASNYKFPLTAATPTGAVAVVEPLVPSQSQLFSAINEYREALGLKPYTASQFQAVTGPTNISGNPNSELALDISVIAGAAPGSAQLLYAYQTASQVGTPFKAYQQAFFDSTNDPGVLSSSWFFGYQPTAGSPFQTAYNDLFVDGALSKVAVHIAAGDTGAFGLYANGVPNVTASNSPTFALVVGGTSVATMSSAKADTTLSALVARALNNDQETLLRLTASGLRTLPSNLPDLQTTLPIIPLPATNTLPQLVETVWNQLEVSALNATTLQVPYGQNLTGAGGADTAQPVPGYQAQFGLAPTTITAAGVTTVGRGTPDVSAAAGGDIQYAALNSNHVTNPSAGLLVANGGTSAAAPLWASLTAQLNAVFADQGLPSLGFYNDLLYQAAALVPASFNDITLGNNIDTFYPSGGAAQYVNSGQRAGGPMVPTGLGFTAGPGYDQTSGLGTPDALLLARTLTAIAHAQSSVAGSSVIGNLAASSGTSSVSQTLLVQDELGADTVSTLQIAGSAPIVATGGSKLAWTSRLAGQVLQKDFDPALVTKLDGAAHGTITSVSLNPLQGVDVVANGNALGLHQVNYTNSFGIVQFGDASSHVTLARPVSIAQTAGGANNQDAIVRVRQVTTDTLKLDLYKVDDLNGTINGIAPGQAGYAAAAAARDYRTDNGTTAITGPGYGNYGEARLKGVNAGDIVAMHLSNVTTGGSFWGFALANEKAGGSSVNHLWSYGLNTYGWEATTGGGDGDYNDLIVGIDFTSGSGHQLIA